MLPNPLLDDLDAERTADLIATGNLRKTRIAAQVPFSPVWLDAGYIARVEWKTCACGNIGESLLGIFHKEHASTGEARYTALSRGFQIPLNKNYPIEVIESQTAACPSCLESKGFSWSTK